MIRNSRPHTHLSRSEWLTPAIGQAHRLSYPASHRICTQPKPEIAAQLMCIYGMHSEAKLTATFVCQGCRLRALAVLGHDYQDRHQWKHAVWRCETTSGHPPIKRVRCSNGEYLPCGCPAGSSVAATSAFDSLPSALSRSVRTTLAQPQLTCHLNVVS